MRALLLLAAREVRPLLVRELQVGSRWEDVHLSSVAEPAVLLHWKVPLILAKCPLPGCPCRVTLREADKQGLDI